MNTIERDLLHWIITDQPFAEYITQRIDIDIGDFDDEVANRSHVGIVDLPCQGRRISFEVLAAYFREDQRLVEIPERIAGHQKSA